MSEAEMHEAIKLLPTFIKMCENNLEEDEHDIQEPLSWEQFEQVEKLIQKLNSCYNFVEQTIFE